MELHVFVAVKTDLTVVIVLGLSAVRFVLRYLVQVVTTQVRIDS
jgi:hypothetical protein